MNYIPINIMFVEDDPTTLNILEDNLSLWGVVNKVIARPTCESAKEFLIKSQFVDLPDILFLDRKFKNSEMQGDELLAWIRENSRFKDMHIAMFTHGNMDIETVDNYHQLGVDAGFDKGSICNKNQFHEFMERRKFKIQYTKMKQAS